MNELISLLEKVSDDIRDITDVTKRSKEIGVTTVFLAEIRKRLRDKKLKDLGI